jgi:regulator of sirC expression with transglutaminase-like and TPR domain
MQPPSPVLPLLAALEADPPLIEEVAFAIAEDEYPALSRERYRTLLDELADSARTAMAVGDESLRLQRFLDHVYGPLGFRGNEDDYYDPKNSYLNEVLERRTGIPITLAVVLMALGRRVGLRIEGIAFPGHFLARAGGDTYLDPFHKGRILERTDLEALAERFLGNPRLTAGQLEPVEVRVIAVRMLYNLQQIYERRGDHARALVVCDRLVDVADAPFHRRDRGIHALALGAHEAAQRDLEAYLATHADATDATRIRQLLGKARGHRRLN